MVRFSCFSLCFCDIRSKKAAQHHSAHIFPAKVHKGAPGRHQSPVTKESLGSACSYLNTDVILSSPTTEQMETPSFECGHSDEAIAISSVHDDFEIQQTRYIKKSQSLGSGLETRDFSCSTDIGVLEGKSLLGDASEVLSGNLDPFNKSESVDSFDRPDSERYYERDLLVRSDQNRDYVHHEPFFSIQDPVLVYRGLHSESHKLHSAGHSILGNFTHAKSHLFKSRSFPSLCGYDDLSFSSPHELPRRSTSFQGLCTTGMKDKFFPGPGGVENGIQQQPRKLLGCNMELSSDLIETKSSCRAIAEEYTDFNLHYYSTEMRNQETNAVNSPHLSDEYESHHLNDLGDDFEDPKMQDIQRKDNQEKFGHHENLTGEELNLRRVQDWLSRIDIHQKFPSEMIDGQISGSVAKLKDNVHRTTASKTDTRDNPGTEVAYKYISSLTAVSTSAQMAGLGLAVIPFLGAFTSLRLLNLSGNSIVRISAGALPRGLHVLNLSKNNISTVEGLRDLTRLRILDLSYNRILRIGHGLSACSSLKELYLASNKISEVEGLHRLLKLSILDLSYNKISTTNLGQLAANYSSLQAINLDGNPAHRNVGDEQLKKYMLSLLPHLVYFNNHGIRMCSSKEASDRSTRSSSSYQFDRFRSEQKRLRRGHHGSTSHRNTHHGKSVHISSTLSKQPRTPHASSLRPPGSKPGHQRKDPRLLSPQLSNSIRKSQSAGNLG